MTADRITTLYFKCTPCGVHVVVSNDSSSPPRVRSWFALANDKERPTLMRCPVCVSQIELERIEHRPAGEPAPRCGETYATERYATPDLACELPRGHHGPHFSRTHDLQWTPPPPLELAVDDD